MGQNVSLSCSSKNTSVNVTYSLFLGRKHLQTKKSGQTVTFYLKISNADETGPYKCKTNDSSGQKYSQDFNFTIANLPSPKLNSRTNVVSMGQNVSLSCSSKNTSVNVTYSLFLGRKHLQTKKSGQTVTFYLKISNADETGPYKCKTNDSSGQKYSQDFNFTIAKAGQPQELHYATPVFKEVVPREQEGHAGNKTDYVYSNLTY
ncbi:Allergin-1 [Microtus ochrogaster]|uniref:Allergin-1 n=1 Tax=Microtus ochrogaster TaxID=79684 RepID=A0A8J6GEJ1_MICOH|nr:Allergin-1 [Microtus ochrogaster]